MCVMLAKPLTLANDQISGMVPVFQSLQDVENALEKPESEVVEDKSFR